MGKIVTFVGKEILEALPATLFFLILFHLVALTKAVVLDDYSITALRAVGATVGALIVAKAILVVNALPITKIQTDKRIIQVLWSTFLYGIVVLFVKVVEEAIPLISKHGSVITGLKALFNDVNWPLFWVIALWTVGGLMLFSLATELASAVGAARIKAIFFGGKQKI
jgi:hypothetical protein